MTMDREDARLRLMEERVRLEKEVEVFEDELGVSLEDASEESIYDQHMAETAAVTLDREIDLTLEENARAALEKVDRALTKLDEGSYGVCDSCKGAISEERLRASPSASLCIDCKRREERGR